MNLPKPKAVTTLALLALGTSLASAAYVVDSFETTPLLSPAFVNPPYTSVSQSTLAGVTQGLHSMRVDYTNDAWQWMYTADALGNNWRDTATYIRWLGHKSLKIDLHRPALDLSPASTGWNLEVLAAMNGPENWQQAQLVNWAWLNNGESSTETLTWDYSAIRNAAPKSGSWWQLNLLARGSYGGTVYFDNARFVDPVDLGFTFPTNSSSGDLGGWAPSWGSAAAAAYWDPTDANTNPASGSMNCWCYFTNGPGGFQNAAFQTWNFVLDPTEYDKLVFDIKVDPTSSPSYTGDYGAVQVVLRGNDIAYASLGTFVIPASAGNSFVHYEIPLYPPVSTNLVGMNLIFQGTNFQEAVYYYVDNLLFVVETNAPALTMQKALPGLELNACDRATDQRQSIRSASGNYNWTKAAGAVTYSMTVNEGLPASAAGMMAYLYLVGTTNADPGALGDWDESNGIFLEIHQQADGLCNASLLFKTNAPAANGVRYSAEGTLATVANVPMTGTWSLTLNQNNFALSTPGGGATNGLVPASVTGEFSTNVFAYFGVQPNQAANVGQYVTLARARISGLPSPIDEVFSSQNSLNTSVFVVRAANTAGIQMRPSNVAERFSWPAPSAGFALQSASSLSGTWASPGLPAVAAGPRNVTFLPSTALPSAGAGFFRLEKP